ncbi:hypothetical protein V8F20_007294 [Naviculisporaceae sp. PSN 640]
MSETRSGRAQRVAGQPQPLTWHFPLSSLVQVFRFLRHHQLLHSNDSDSFIDLISALFSCGAPQHCARRPYSTSLPFSLVSKNAQKLEMGRVKGPAAKKKRGESRGHRHPKPGQSDDSIRLCRLDTLLPRAGMIYPFQKGIMRQGMGDTRIALALAKSQGIEPRRLAKQVVERWAADLFFAAEKFLRSPLTPQLIRGPPGLMSAVATVGATAQIDAGSGASLGPLSLLFTLRGWLLGVYAPTTQPAKWDGEFEWLNGISFNMFAAFFLLLRSARLRWHKNPRHPLSIAEHSVLPQAIDQFNKAAERVEWGGLEMVLWLRDGAMWLDTRQREDGKKGKGKAPAAGEGMAPAVANGGSSAPTPAVANGGSGASAPAVANGGSGAPAPGTSTGAQRERDPLALRELRELMELLSIDCPFDLDAVMSDV